MHRASPEVSLVIVKSKENVSLTMKAKCLIQITCLCRRWCPMKIDLLQGYWRAMVCKLLIKEALWWMKLSQTFSKIPRGVGFQQKRRKSPTVRTISFHQRAMFFSADTDSPASTSRNRLRHWHAARRYVPVHGNISATDAASASSSVIHAATPVV